MKTIKLLSSEQEKALLRMLVEKYTADANGASRIVFLVDSSDIQGCGIDVDINRDYVIKVAIGLAGINQNGVESNAYRYYGETYALAEVPYIGHYIEIMEAVEVWDLRGTFDDNYDYFYEIMHENYDFDEDRVREFYDVVLSMEDINGYTSDNAQVGINKEGRVVAFDYGFDNNTDERFCSTISQWTDFDSDVETTERYLNALVDLIDAEDEAVDELERSLCKELGAYFYDDEEDDEE